MVDAQPETAPEGIHSVVPPGEGFLRRSKPPETVLEAEGKEAAKSFALFGAAQHLPLPGPRIVDILVRWSDVVVAQDRQTRMTPQLVLQPVPEGGEPFQLVPEFFRGQGLAVGDIRRYDAKGVPAAPQRSRDHALLFIRETWNSVGDERCRELGQYRDAVVGLLSRPRAAVSGALDFLKRELAVLELGFLEADRVRRVPCEPVEQMRQPNLERIDVP